MTDLKLNQQKNSDEKFLDNKEESILNSDDDFRVLGIKTKRRKNPSKSNQIKKNIRYQKVMMKIKVKKKKN